jgi:adenosylmethionine-8-amino-7-oxononanoate aminotransferase
MVSPPFSREDLVKRDHQVCWHPYTQHGLKEELLPIVRASGSWIELADGTRMLDAISSWWTCLHGHGHPDLIDALYRQATSLDHVLFAGCTHPAAIELAEQLVNRSPEGLTRVFYSDNGSTAVEVALKAAIQYWLRQGNRERTHFVALEGAYHGDTFGAMAAGDPDPFFVDFAPFLFHVQRAAPTTEAITSILSRNTGQVAAVILEPLVQGAAGMQMHSPSFLAEVRRLCDQHDTLLIADEVMTGFGRTGTLFACEQANITPDLLCLAKGLTGGILPLAATVVREKIYEAFLSTDRSRAFFHGHSFTANPIGCAVALASLDIVEREATPNRLDQLGRRIESGLKDLSGRPGIRELRRCGGIVALEMEDPSGKEGYLSELGPRLRHACLGGDVLLRPLGNVLYAIPPASTTLEECDRIANAIRSVSETALL